MRLFNSPSHCKIGHRRKRKMSLIHHFQLRQILNRSSDWNTDIREMLFFILLSEYPDLPESLLPVFTDLQFGTTPWGETREEVHNFIVEHGYDQKGYDFRYRRIVRYVEAFRLIPPNLKDYFREQWGEGRGVLLRHE